MSQDVIKGYCPFYQDEYERTIFCKGITSETMVRNDFVSPEPMKEYKRFFCAGCYFRCENAMMLNAKWENYKVTHCNYNDGVECTDAGNCNTCGWCPTVAQDRLRKPINSSTAADDKR